MAMRAICHIALVCATLTPPHFLKYRISESKDRERDFAPNLVGSVQGIHAKSPNKSPQQKKKRERGVEIMIN